jgi:hypothetical protein
VLDRCHARIGGEVIPVGEALNVAGVTDHHAGNDGAHAIDLGQGGLRGPDRGADPAVRLLDQGVEAPHVVDELAGELVSHVLDGGHWLIALE